MTAELTAPIITSKPSSGDSDAWLFQSSDDDTVNFTSSSGQIGAQVLSIPLQNVIVKLPDHGEGDISRLLYAVTSEEVSEAIPEIHQAWVSGLPAHLGSRKHTYEQTLFKDGRTDSPLLEVVISTGSGTKLAKQFWQTSLQPALAVLREATDFELNVHQTTSADFITKLAENEWRAKIAERANVYIILLSGDGGAVDAVNGLQLWRNGLPTANKPTLVTLPLGSGNALFSSYSYTLRDNTWGLSTLLRGVIRPLPSFRASFSQGARLVVDEGRGEQELDKEDGQPTLHGVVVCSWGLHATLVADSDTADYRKFGAKRFGMVAARLLQPEDGSLPHEYAGRISYMDKDTNEWCSLGKQGYAYILATLVSNLEKTFMISPDSVAQDGVLRLVTIPSISGDKIMQIMGAAYDSGKHIGNENVAYRRIRALRIEFSEEQGSWRRVCIDGKIVRVEQGGWLQVDMDHDSGLNYLTAPPPERT